MPRPWTSSVSTRVSWQARIRSHSQLRSASPTSTQTPLPTLPADSGGLNPLCLLIALAVIIGLIVIVIVMRRNQSDETPPTDGATPPTDSPTPPTDDTADARSGTG